MADMTNIPLSLGAFPPPLGVVPNFEDPDDEGTRQRLMIWLIVPYIFTVGSCAVRAYVKASRWEMFPDDWLCVTAWILITLTLSVDIMTWVYGMGYHSWEVTKEMYINFNKWAYIGSALYIPSVFTTKAAILLLFSRIFAVKHFVARAIQAFIALLFVSLLPIECLKLAICRPVSAYWTMSTMPEELAARCINQEYLFKADITIAIVTDFIILLIPIPLIFSLSFPLWKKIRILLSLATGGGAVGVALYKGVLVYHPSPGHDPTKNLATLTVLTFLEMNIGLICACLPSFTILVDRIRRWGTTQSHSSLSNFRRRNGAGNHPFHLLRKRQGSDDNYSTTTLTTFNTELAMLSGRAEDSDKIRFYSGGIGVDAQGRCVRINSMEGRREGWLAPAPV